MVKTFGTLRAVLELLKDGGKETRMISFILLIVVGRDFVCLFHIQLHHSFFSIELLKVLNLKKSRFSLFTKSKIVIHSVLLCFVNKQKRPF